MSRISLGELKRVELREAWQREAEHFTPWLADETSIRLLADVVGLDLEVEAQEKKVGPFRADILCKNRIDDSWVLIENQLERTDHIHLGQLVTYAAGLHAVTVVWIAAEFTEEHRAAMDWLNEITDEGFNFFALEVELWRIGNSPPAPKFNIVCKPNDWSKQVSRAAARLELSERASMQLAYWAEFVKLLQSQGFGSSLLDEPQGYPWMRLIKLQEGFHIWSRCGFDKRGVGVALVLTGPDRRENLRRLAVHRREVEQEVGQTLEYDEMAGKHESQVFAQLEGADPRQRDRWPQQHQWLSSRLQAFQACFRERIKSLTPADDGEAATSI